MNARLLVTPIASAFCLAGLLNAPTAHAKTWAERCAESRITCIDITVSTADRKITLENPAPLKNPPGKVIWQLPQGYVFNSRGGGINVPHNGEVTVASGVGDDEDDTGKLTRRYKIASRKLQQEYKYTITFHEMNGGMPTRRWVCDPTIVNAEGMIPKPARQPAPPVVMPTAAKTFPCTVTDEP